MNKKDFIKISAILNYAGMHAHQTMPDAETAYDDAVELADMFDWDDEDEDDDDDFDAEKIEYYDSLILSAERNAFEKDKKNVKSRWEI